MKYKTILLAYLTSAEHDFNLTPYKVFLYNVTFIVYYIVKK